MRISSSQEAAGTERQTYFGQKPMNANNQLILVNSAELVRQSTDIAGLCKEIVTKTAISIQGKKYIKAEGWEAIAAAHGCISGAGNVERIEGGFRAIGELRRISDGNLIATAEGYVGEDEPTWFGGETEVWDKEQRKRIKKTLPKRPDYAIRAMAQTRSISRVCRSAFAHVVVLMDAGLSTTPAEEVPFGEFHNDEIEQQEVNRAAEERQERRERVAGTHKNTPLEVHGEPVRSFSEPAVSESQPPKQNDSSDDWRDQVVTFGKNQGMQLGNLSAKQLHWYAGEWLQKKLDSGRISEKDKPLVAALLVYRHENKEHQDARALDQRTAEEEVAF